MKYLICLLCAVLGGLSFAQSDPIAGMKQRALNLADKMYRSELASWNSSDIVQNDLKDKIPNLGGYLSYNKGDETIAIYYDDSEEKKVIFEVTYANIKNFKNLFESNNVERAPTAFELRLIKAREYCQELVYNDKEEYFKHYSQTAYNFVTLFHDNSIVVYALTGPQISGYVALGNDYKFVFDKDDNFISKHRMHSGVKFLETDDKEEATATIHNHNPAYSEIITETDLCTLMLYGPYCKWRKHFVVTNTYVSIWDMDTEELIVMTLDAWDKLTEKERKSKQE